MYAVAKGIYAKYGLDVNLTFIDSGSQAITALITGDMDFCQVGGDAVINAAVAGADVVLIAGFIDTYIFSLMVRPEIESVADLAGRAVAVNTFGGASDSAMRSLLRSFDLIPDEDVTVLAIGGQNQRLAAMETGVVAATLVSVPQTAQARAFGYRQLVNMADLAIPYQYLGLATTRQRIDADRDTALRFVEATVDAIVQMKTDRVGVIDVLADSLQLDREADADILNEAFDVLILGYMAEMPYPTIDGLQQQVAALAMENPAAADYDVAAIIDTTLLDELDQRNFRENLQK
jgi:NitT/TauT family transport system substrate-binding protein